MPMIPVDTAVNIIVGPLIDDTDGKSRETGVAYNAAGMDVDLLKSSDTGTPTSTGLTLTTGGANDWVELSGGYYYVEVTAAQNDTEGKLKLIGIATGILPFESIEYDVVPVAVYNSLVKGTDNLQVDTTQWAGNAVTASSGNPDVNIETIDAGAITAAAIATGAIDADSVATDVITEIWNKVVESNDSVTAQQAMSIILAAVAGVTSSSGATFSDPSGTNVRITGTVNGSNERTAVSLAPSS